jgi:predicted DNA binding protein
MNIELTSVHSDVLDDCLRMAEVKQNDDGWVLVSVIRDVGGKTHYAAVLVREKEIRRSIIHIIRNFKDNGINYAVGDHHDVSESTLIRMRSQYPGRFTEDPLR